MDTFNYVFGTYEDYKSIGGNGGISNGSIYIVDNTPYYYNNNKNTWVKAAENLIGTIDIDSLDTIKDVCGYYEPTYKTIPPICPHCGAPTKPHLNSCEYCDVYFD